MCDALSRLCGNVMRTHYTPDQAPRILGMSKRAIFHRKQLETEDPLVLELAGREESAGRKGEPKEE